MWKCDVINTPLCEFKPHPGKQLVKIYFSPLHFPFQLHQEGSWLKFH